MQKSSFFRVAVGSGRIVLILLPLACVNLTRPAEIELTESSTPDGDAPSETDAAVIDGRSGPDTAPYVGDSRAGAPDASPSDGALFDNGRRCLETGQCSSGNCVDGVCCASACNQPCFVCNAGGTEGTCTPVVAGEDPGNECVQDPSATCANDGTCNGMGACRRYLAGTECTPGRCTISTEYAASSCDGAGACREGSSRSCSPNMCVGNSCASTCSSDNACQAGFFCESNTCRSKRAVGSACSRTQECGSGFCVDGVCCNSACSQRCSSCALATARGTCTAAPGGQDPRNECPAEVASTCGRAGACDGRGGCRLHAAGTACAGASCSGSLQTAGASCDGLGTCVPGTTRDCSPFVCGAGACATSCTSSAGCRAGHACNSGQCILAGLALNWKFDETSGTSAVDSSGTGRNGTYLGTGGIPSSSTSVPPLMFPNPRSRAFVRAERQAVLLEPMPTQLKTESFTLSVWFRATTVDSLGSDIVSGGNDYLLRLFPTEIEFSKRISLVSGAMFAKCDVISSVHLDGGFHHLAAVNSPTGMRVYFDGAEVCANTRTEPMLFTGSQLTAGRHGAGVLDHDFEGNIDDVRIYTRPLSPAEAQSLARGAP